MTESREIGDKHRPAMSRDRRRAKTSDEQRSVTSTTDHEPWREEREQRTEMKEVREERVRIEKEPLGWVNKKPFFFILQYNYSALSKMRVHCSKIVNFIAFTSFDGECFLGFNC